MIAEGLRTGRALLLVDFQEDFLTDSGRMTVARHQIPSVLAGARRAIEDARAAGDLIVKIGNEFRKTDVARNLLRHYAAIAGSEGTRWDSRVAVEAVYLPKWKPDAFCNPSLASTLDEASIGSVSVAGLFAAACVTATSRTALERGMAVTLLADAIACRSDASRDKALEHLSVLGAHVRHRPDGYLSD